MVALVGGDCTVENGGLFIKFPLRNERWKSETVELICMMLYPWIVALYNSVSGCIFQEAGRGGNGIFFRI